MLEGRPSRAHRALIKATTLALATLWVTAAGTLAGCSGSPSASTKPGGSITLTISGEALALEGYGFPPSAGQEVAFVDGWEVRFEHVLTTVGHVTLHEGPDTSPGDKATLGAQVAELEGPFAVDLHTMAPGEPGVVTGKGGGGELALELGTLTSKSDGRPFDSTQRYAFGFELLAAEAGATRVNLDAEASALYDEMVASGVTTLVTGTATWRGDACEQTDSGEAAPYDFSALPQTVHFVLPLDYGAALHNVNCENPDNDPAEALPGEESLRGIQVKENTDTVAQITLHTDHLFWTTLEHDSPLSFDHYAAWAAEQADGAFVVTLEDLAGVALEELLDRGGAKVPWRSCLAGVPVTTTPMFMSFDPAGLTLEEGLHDFVLTASATMGHLNADGLCLAEGFEAHSH